MDPIAELARTARRTHPRFSSQRVNLRCYRGTFLLWYLFRRIKERKSQRSPSISPSTHKCSVSTSLDLLVPPGGRSHQIPWPLPPVHQLLFYWEKSNLFVHFRHSATQERRAPKIHSYLRQFYPNILDLYKGKLQEIGTKLFKSRCWRKHKCQANSWRIFNIRMRDSCQSPLIYLSFSVCIFNFSLICEKEI